MRGNVYTIPFTRYIRTWTALKSCFIPNTKDRLHLNVRRYCSSLRPQNNRNNEKKARSCIREKSDLPLRNVKCDSLSETNQTFCEIRTNCTHNTWKECSVNSCYSCSMQCIVTTVQCKIFVSSTQLEDCVIITTHITWGYI